MISKILLLFINISLPLFQPLGTDWYLWVCEIKLYTPDDIQDIPRTALNWYT